MNLSTEKSRKLQAVPDDDGVTIIERGKYSGKWIEDRVFVTRKELATLARAFPVQNATENNRQ